MIFCEKGSKKIHFQRQKIFWPINSPHHPPKRPKKQRCPLLFVMRAYVF